MSVTAMTSGDSATATVGPSASVVSKPGSSLLSLVENTIMAGVMLNMLEGKGQPQMRPGDSMLQTLGGGAEVYSKTPNSGFTKAVVGLALLGVVGKLLDSNTAPPPSQDQMRKEMQAQDDTRLANIKLEDARKQEAYVQDEQRKAFFANKGPG